MPENLTENITISSMFEGWGIMPSSLEGLDYPPVAPPVYDEGIPGFSPNHSVPIGHSNLSAPFEIDSIEQALRMDLVRNMADGLDLSLSRRLIEISSLSPGWDGYSAPQVSIDIIDRATQLLLVIMIIGRGRFPLPFVAPLPDGGLELEWETETGKELILVLSPERPGIEFLFNQGSFEETGVTDGQGIEVLVRRFLS